VREFTVSGSTLNEDWGSDEVYVDARIYDHHTGKLVLTLETNGSTARGLDDEEALRARASTLSFVKLSAYGEITSVVVSRGGDVIVEEYREGEAGTLRNTRSCTKTVAGMLLGIAIDRGIVPGVDTPLADVLGEPAPPVTLRDVLTMSSCLDCNDWDDASPGNEELMYPRQDWLAFALGLPIREARTFSYCTAGVVALGIGLERALGEPHSVFAQRELFDPRGIDKAGWQHTPLGQTSTAGGLLLTSRALLSLGELYLRGGGGIVPAEWVMESLTPHARIDAETGYGYLWWLKSLAGERTFYMSGMGGNRVHVFPDSDLVAVITTTNFRRRDAHALSDRLVVEQILGA
jgi:CubicO group peptidase (beta-lactamase class C family)